MWCLIKFVIPLLLLFPALIWPGTGTVAVIEIHGSIGEDASARDVVDILDSLEGHDAVILDIDSPGGSTVDSHEIVRAVSRLGIPKVALVRGSATSGAYWVAAATDHIVADELSFVGSLGALMSFLSVEGLARKYGVSAEVITYPGNKSFGSVFRDLTPQEREYAERLTKSAAEYLNSSISELRPSAARYFTGYPFLARDAPELVDSYGGFREAVRVAEELSGKRLRPEFISPQKGIRELFREAIGLRADAPFNFFKLAFQLPYYV